MKIRNLLLPVLLVLAAENNSFAQEIRIHKQIVGSPEGELMLPTFDFITANGFVDAKTVKGAPFAAEFSSESVQTLADGNRIVKRSNSNVYRDVEGRTRREQSFPGFGGATISSVSDSSRHIFIFDPVANTNYTLNSLTQTAFRSKVFKITVDDKNIKGFPQVKVFRSTVDSELNPEIKKRIEKIDKNPQIFIKELGNRPPMEKPREEALGIQNIEGVEAEGKRVTRIIPAGFMGNEKPIEIVRESWYSKELQMVVMSVDKNPLSGEHTYKITKFSRGEQPRTLFEVPSDYKIIDGSKMLNHMYNFPPMKSGAVFEYFKNLPAEK